MLGGCERTLVDISLGVVGSLVLLVDDGVLGGSGTAGKACVVVLGDLLVGLLGCLSTSSLNGLGDVVCGVLGEEDISRCLRKR
jgi:hypothetical protein